MHNFHGNAFFKYNSALPATTTTSGVVVVPDEITCVNFDAGWNGFGATNWVYVQPINVDREPSAFIGSAAKFGGSGRLEIPRFSNAYGQWTEFAVSFWYKRNSRGGSAAQGLCSNGNCVARPSISIVSMPGTIGAQLITTGGSASVTGIQVSVRFTHAYVHLRLSNHNGPPYCSILHRIPD